MPELKYDFSGEPSMPINHETPSEAGFPLTHTRLPPEEFSSAKIRETNRTPNFFKLVSEIVASGGHLPQQVLV